MRVIAFITIATLVTSCGMIKNVTRHKDKSKIETDSVATSQVHAETVEKEETITVITMEADTSATVKGTTIEGSTTLKDLANHPLVLDDGTQQVTVKLDADGKVTAQGKTKDQVVPLKYRKRIEQKILADRKAKTKTEARLSEKKSTSSKSTATEKEVKRYGLPWIILVVLLIAIYITLRKRFSFLP